MKVWYQMDRKEKIERVASGLRKMGCAPDAFVVTPFEEEIWDKETILDIPVYYLDVPVEYKYNGGIIDPPCYFMPVWKSDRSDNEFLSKQFFMGWEDFCYEKL